MRLARDPRRERASLGDYVITGAVYVILIVMVVLVGSVALICWAFDSLKAKVTQYAPHRPS